MNLYMLTFSHRNKPEYTWFEAETAGEGVNLIEELGVSVIETVKIKDEQDKKLIKKSFYELKSKIRYLKTQKDYKHYE